MRSVTDHFGGRPVKTTTRLALLTTVILAALAGNAPGAPRERVDSAIERGLTFLYSMQKPDGTFATRFSGAHRGGAESLVALAALTSGQSVSHKNVAACLEYANRSDPQTVYARSVRAMAYARIPTGEYAKRMAADVAWLIKHRQLNGGWGYGPAHDTTRYTPQWTDNSNTQMAVWALHEAELAGATVGDGFWRKCLEYWIAAQNTDGGWGYTPPAEGAIMGGSYASMTAAGAATCYLLTGKLSRQALPYDNSGKRNRSTPLEFAPMHRAMKWLDDNYATDSVPGALTDAKDTWLYYYLLNLARAADESGTGRIKGNDWLDGQLTDSILRGQGRDGGWHGGGQGDAVIRTSFAVLALLRARSGLLIMKIAATQEAQDDFFDAANLARWYQKRTGQQVCWRQADENTQSWQMRAAPIVLISGRGLFTLPKGLDGRVQWYVYNGGTVVVHAIDGDEAFTSQVVSFFKRRFAHYSLGPLNADHPVFSLRFPVPYEKFSGIRGFSDGCRTRIFILPGDVSGAWHHGAGKDYQHAFNLIANIALYTTDGQPVASKVPPSGGRRARTTGRIRIAHIVHKGDWNTNPYAPQHLNNVLANSVSLGIRRETTNLKRGLWKDLKLLWLTGTRGPKLDKTQLKTLKTHLMAGGFLFADPATGGEEFFNATRAMLEEMFGRESFTRLGADSPIITGQIAGGAGSDIRTVQYTRAMAEMPDPPTAPVLWQVKVGERIVAIVSRYGVTCPLEGQPTWGCKGLSTPDARRLAANIVLYAASRK